MNRLRSSSLKYIVLLVLVAAASLTGTVLYPPQPTIAKALSPVDSPGQKIPETELARIIASDGTLTAKFGTSVDIDGDTLVIGAPFSRDAADATRGAVYIYVRSGSTWNFQAKLDPPVGSGSAAFGSYVAVSGNTLVAGAPQEDIDGITKGTASVFIRSGQTWSFQQKLAASDGLVGAQFGTSVGIENDTVVVGAVQGVVGVIRQGSAYVFVRSGAVWSEEAKLIDSNGNDNDQYGLTLDISGNTVIVGARFADMAGIFGGVACIYTRTGTVWTRQARIMASDAAEDDAFGSSVAIEGDTAVVGAPRNRITGTTAKGAAYVFVRSAGVWSEVQRLFYDHGPDFSEMGTSVAISGEKLIVGDSGYTVGTSNRGAAYLFIKNGATWQFQNKLMASQNSVSDRVGTSVAIQGNRFFAGAPGVDIGGNTDQGAVYSFTQAPFAPDLQASSDSGVSNSDNITKLQNLSFDVGGITPGATVELLRDGAVVDSEVVGGSFAVLTDNAPANGTFQYAARQVVAGEASAPSEAIGVTVDTSFPALTVNQKPTQQDPTLFGSNIGYVVTFNELVTQLEQNDISLAGSTANVTGATIELTQTGIVQYEVLIGGVVSNGQFVMASVPAGAVTDLAGNVSVASSSTDNTVTVDNVRPTVTVDQAVGQADPTAALPVNYTVVFSEPVDNFEASDLAFGNSTVNVGPRIVNITGGPTTYNVAISNLTSNGGFVRLAVNNGVTDAIGNQIMPSTSTDNTITLDNVGPTVAISQAAGQADPTASQPIRFRALFNENVTGLGPGDVSLVTSSSNVSQAVITIEGSGNDYTISVSNVITSGQVRLTIPAGGVIDALGNQNAASTAVDNTVTLQIPASASITGRVVNSAGRGLGMVRVVINLPGGETRYTQTNPFGYYRFINAPTGSATITVSRKNMAPVVRNFFLVQDTTGFDITIDYSQ